VLREDERRAVIDIRLVVPVGIRHVPEWAANAHPGIIDEDIKAVNACQCRFRQPVRVLNAGEIRHNTERGDAERPHRHGGGLDRRALAS